MPSCSNNENYRRQKNFAISCKNNKFLKYRTENYILSFDEINKNITIMNGSNFIRVYDHRITGNGHFMFSPIGN